MAMQRWDPFNELRQMQDTMNRIWKGYQNPSESGGFEAWAVPLDVVRKGDDIEVRASVPGVDPDNIQITVENDVLTISGRTESENEKTEGDFLMRERRSGSFHRALRLPDTVDVERAETGYNNGVVTISFPKLESKKAKKLSLTVS